MKKPFYRLSTPRERQQLLREFAGSHRGLFRGIELRIDRMCRVRIGFCQGDIPEDRSKNVVEIVCDSSRKDTDRLESLSLEYLFFQLPDLRDIPDYAVNGFDLYAEIDAQKVDPSSRLSCTS